jgi:hypothetical protein
MKNKDYCEFPNYFRLWEKMEMLGIKDISSPCQEKNGTVVWRLPIKNTYSRKGEFIEVASYEAGYVRVLNTCMSPYYINKPVFNHVSDSYGEAKKPKLIPIEIERLEYLISYCLKNMYIKLANERQTLPARFEMNALRNKLANSVPKWKYDEAMKLGRKQDLALNDLENKLAVTEANTELFREVHLSAYNKMIKIKEIIGC